MLNASHDPMIATPSVQRSPAVVIEDHEDQAFVFRNALEIAGYDVEVINDGLQALARLQDITPRLIVLDMHLPGVTGADILKKIRVDKRFEDVTIILATADDQLASYWRDEVFLVLLKPVSFMQLKQFAERIRATQEMNPAS
jgi:CheY-like chemotaxis protein